MPALWRSGGWRPAGADRQYLHPFEGVNLLLFAAWPMLAACLALYALRDADTLTAESWRQTNRTHP